MTQIKIENWTNVSYCNIDFYLYNCFRIWIYFATTICDFTVAKKKKKFWRRIWI